jgi:hypothetical protein
VFQAVHPKCQLSDESVRCTYSIHITVHLIITFYLHRDYTDWRTRSRAGTRRWCSWNGQLINFIVRPFLALFLLLEGRGRSRRKRKRRGHIPSHGRRRSRRLDFLRKEHFTRIQPFFFHPLVQPLIDCINHDLKHLLRA